MPVSQRIKAAQPVTVSELSPVYYELDNLDLVHGSPAFDQSPVEMVHNASLNATLFNVARKAVQ